MMVSRLFVLFLSLALGGLVGCKASGLKSVANTETDRGESLHLRIEGLLQDGRDEEALAALDSPEALSYRGSWSESLSLLRADALMAVDRLGEAEEILRGVRERQALNRPLLATMAEWRLSFVAEARGDDARALMHLESVRRRSTDIPEEIRLAELPVRFALLSHRIGATEEASRHFAEAERGLRILLSGDRRLSDPSWLAKLYFDMGRSVSPDLSGEDFEGVLRSQLISQRYLLMAIETGRSPWADRALSLFRRQLLSLWGSIENLRAPGEMGGVVRSRWVREGQIRRSAALLDLLDEVSLRRPPELGGFEAQAHELVDEVRQRARAMTESTLPMLMLTEESLRPRRPIRSRSDSADPNL